MTVRVELEEVEGGTQVTLTHAGLPSDELSGIVEGGWTVSLGLLQDLVFALLSAYAGARMSRGTAEEKGTDA